MKVTLKVSAVAAAIALTACVPSSPSSTPTKTEWNVRCNTDAVNLSTECFAGTFGSPMNSEGQPYLPPAFPLKIFYRNGRGPYMQVGWHNFPGEQPTIRFDDDGNSYTIPDDGGVSAIGTANSAVNRMKTASVARARFWTFPDGSKDMYVDVTGFSAALAELQTLVGK